MEKKTEVKTYIVDLCCDKCSSVMKSVKTDFSSLMFTNLSNTVECIYRCPKCGYEVKLTEVYPKIQYENISNECI